MFYLASDPHGWQDRRALEEYAARCTADDWLLLLGDLELHFRDTDENRDFTAYFESLPCRIAFVDGNHENFDHLDSLPQEDWNGGRIHRLSENIVHLMRGYVFDLDGKTFLTMGGCVSSAKWKEMGLWYPQENPTPEEIQRGIRNLTAHGNRVDYVLTHTYFQEPYDTQPTSLGGFIRYVEEHASFNHWYSGHCHCHQAVDPKHTIVYDRLVTI